MPASTNGLARVTIRAPRRRLDLAMPHQVPLAELLPEVVRRAGEAGADRPAAGAVAVGPGGWVLRRGDGASLIEGAALAHQGVRDGEVLYLVPRNLSWPEPDFDDVIEEVAAGVRRHARAWDPAATRLFALAVAGLALVVGLAAVLVLGTRDASAGRPAAALAGVASAMAAITLLATGAVLARALEDTVAGVAAAGYALAYAAAAGIVLAPGTGSGVLVSEQVLVAAAALVLAAVVGAVAVGRGLRVFTAGVTLGAAALAGGLFGLFLNPAAASSIVTVAAVAGVGLAPLVSVRLGRLPMPVVSAAPDVIAAEQRPRPAQVLVAVARADEILAGTLIGIGAAGLGCVVVLSLGGGTAARLLAVLASVALLVRARLFAAVSARLPLLFAGASGLAVTVWAWTGAATTAVVLATAGLAFVLVMVLVGVAAGARRPQPGAWPYVDRLADLLDVGTVVALAPVACAVLGLYDWVRGLAG